MFMAFPPAGTVTISLESRMHTLIASPFLEQYVLVRPGSRGGATVLAR
jgi:hypothetical protein